MLRRSVLLLSLVLILGFTFGQAAFAQFDDAPSVDSWVYDSFKVVYDAGLIKGYPDGTFKGGRPATRNEVVTFMARLMAYFEAKLAEAKPVQSEQPKAEVPCLTEDQVKDLINEALTEHASKEAEKKILSEEDVKALIAEALAEENYATQDDLAALSEEVDRVYEAIQELEEALRADLDSLDVRVTTLEEQVKAIEAKNDKQDEAIAKLQSDLANTNKALEEAKAQAAQDKSQTAEETKKAKTMGTIGTILGALGVLLFLI